MAETVDLIISTKTEKLWSFTNNKQGTNKRRSRDIKRFLKDKKRSYRSGIK